MMNQFSTHRWTFLIFHLNEFLFFKIEIIDGVCLPAHYSVKFVYKSVIFSQLLTLR